RACQEQEQDNYNVIDGEKEAKPVTYSPSPHAPPRVSSSCMTSPYDDSPRLREREREKERNNCCCWGHLLHVSRSLLTVDRNYCCCWGHFLHVSRSLPT
ncbi:unnamed protein product, partial [Musa hybrid cultivar]